MEPYIYRRPKPKRKFSVILLYILIAVAIIFIFFDLFLWNRKLDKENFPIINPLAKVESNTAVIVKSRENSTELTEITQGVLGEEIDDYGIIIENLNAGERYYHNEHKIFETASLYKLWIMAQAYEDIEAGILNKEDILTDSVPNLNRYFNIASESAELTEGVVSQSIEGALTKMITISDNYSAYLLTKKVGISNVSAFLNEHSFLDSKVGTATSNPVSSPRDIADFLRQLNEGKLANARDTEEMIDLLKGQQVNTKLSKNLPEDAIIAHKTGELNMFSHDAGIVYGKKDDYIIVVMSETDNQLTANENIAEISRMVYDYFEK